MRNDDDIAIRVSGLGKRYLVPQRHETTRTAPPTWRDNLKEFFPGLMGAGDKDYFWALRDVSFQVRRGEVFGIIGENGSGKSTLLKILSGVTPPSAGEAELRGRVGSLLEVGTGFHPDLTGRENVFFNGSLLGIRQAEIRAKLEEIIEFSGIGEFIDVPVKRYSSGMYVRLAFSVTALLQSDILILDEVLSVGDAAFRAKTESGIKSAMGQGRTVLFVSHNPKAVASICNRAIILHKGRLKFEGDAKDMLADYLSGDYLEAKPSESAEQKEEPAKPRARESSHVDLSRRPRLRQPGVPEPTNVLKWLSVHDASGAERGRFYTGEGVRFQIGFAGIRNPETAYFSVLIHNSVQDRVATIHSTHIGRHVGVSSSGIVECTVPSLMLGDGLYSIMIDSGHYDFDTNRMLSEDCVRHALYLRFENKGVFKGTGLGEFQGAGHKATWTIAGDRKPCSEGRRMKQETQIAVVSYPKTGNKWLQFIIGRYLQNLTGGAEIVLPDGSPRVNALLAGLGFPPITSWTHAPLTWEDQTAEQLTRANVVAPFSGQKVVLLSRYPLDVLLSAFFHNNYQKGSKSRRIFPSFKSFVSDPVYGMDKLVRFYRIWANSIDDVDGFVVRYEDLQRDCETVVSRLFAFCGFSIDEAALQEAVRFSSFENMQLIERTRRDLKYESSGLNVFATGAGDDPKAMHVRFGQPGVYRDYLSTEDAKKYEQFVAQTFPARFGCHEPACLGG